MLLRQLREERGMRVNDVDAQLDWSSGKISRMERNEWKLPSVRDMEDLARLYEVDESIREALIALARQARTRGWWVQHKDVLRGSLPDWESGASMIRTYEGMLVPGLLQSPDYAAAILRSGRVLGDDEIRRKVDLRMERQKILDHEEAPRLWAIIDESALRKRIGGEKVIRGQIEHLLTMAERSNIDLSVIYDHSGAHPALGDTFVILDYPDPEDLPLVYIETATEDLIVEDPEAIQYYVQMFGHTYNAGASPDESVSYLESLLK
ncbi:helix-turn-helix transcriptional regulator [Lipingzhangella sp. LS1_29]|uniref:Helix-turn-helix transcriptional regulator n=1 Tax=Lipingzhangella rawalii TaxID=2055835 RepID=A0ABU2HBI1_9ACTN|nr:helix-turn-helix transcriptional regulator [Lipingzhangella rawalii]MDS1272684.1 helix-turn-helix transcriptional regulator [Lipingzhangella rawalii]